MIHFCCLFASQQMASPKPWMKNLMYHIFHIFFILQTIMLQVTFLHTDNKKKNNLSIITFGKQFVSENKIAFKKNQICSCFISVKNAYLFPVRLFKSR